MHMVRYPPPSIYATQQHQFSPNHAPFIIWIILLSLCVSCIAHHRTWSQNYPLAEQATNINLRVLWKKRRKRSTMLQSPRKFVTPFTKCVSDLNWRLTGLIIPLVLFITFFSLHYSSSTSSNGFSAFYPVQQFLFNLPFKFISEEDPVVSKDEGCYMLAWK